MGDPRRAERLRSIGVRWGKDFHQRWQEGYDRLIDYKREFGHCDMDDINPLGISNTQHQKLVGWAGNQRSFRRDGTLLPEREAMLNNVGFTWYGPVGTIRAKLMTAREEQCQKRKNMSHNNNI